MNQINIRKISITDIAADCIVNAANAQLAAGGGVCGAIFEAAGYRELTKACSAFGGCKTGSAVITPGFRSKAKYIIHAVGPVWKDGQHREPKLLYGCYQKSLELAVENGCHSIAFPLISSGIYGYPKDKAWRKALQSCNDFLREHPDCDLEVTFCVLNDRERKMGQDELDRQEQEFIDNLFASKNPMFGGCPTIEAALEAWYAGGQADASPVIETLVTEMLDDAEVIIPLLFENPAGDAEDAEMRATLQHLEAENGKYFLPLFTSMTEVNKGAKTSTAPQLLRDMMQIAVSDESCAGVVINPWDKNITLPVVIVRQMLDAAQPLSEDEKNLNIGSEAYRKGDFVTALTYYTLAAEAGNVTAMSNLGYCYYYGRSIPVDKEMARTCWEKAAVLGDICAIYKLGDLYRNGDLPVDLVFSEAMYKKAFAEASKEKPLYSYPDACLRILKYCRETCNDEDYRAIAEDCAEGFRQRMEDGDSYSVKLYQEALEILEGLD